MTAAGLISAGAIDRRGSTVHSRERLFLEMVRIRRFEEKLQDLWEQGLISGEMHLGIGEEAIVAGVLAHLEDGDALALDHRSTPPLVVRGTDLVAIISELLGCEDGLCRGRGGHMHLFDPDRLAASSGIVGASAPTACGFALAAQQLRPGSVAFAFFGEGAMNQGMVMEALNLAEAWKLPVVFVCKDSRWAITTRSRTVTAGSLIGRARSFGIHASCVDGTNVDAVARAARSAVAHARSGRGPSFILARCRRPHGHFLGDPLLRVFGDPIGQAREIGAPLIDAAAHGPGAQRPVRLGALLSVGRVVARFGFGRFVEYRDPLRRTRRRLARNVARGCEKRRARVREASRTGDRGQRPGGSLKGWSTDMTTFAQGIERALEHAMERDERVVIFGEDVHMLRRNLLVRFGPSRVRNTPISESAFLGAAVGASMAGLRPVVELMFVDFVGVALDPLLNHAAKLKTFSGGRWSAPMVVRAGCGGGYGDGGQHEQSLWGLLAGIPGLSVVVPSNPYDAAGLMLSAIAHDDPVVYLEHKLLSDYWLDYVGAGNRRTVSFDVPHAGAYGEVPVPPVPVAIGTAATLRSGSDVALVSLGLGVHNCLTAARALAGTGVQCTVLDLRSAAPLDRQAILDAADMTGNVVAVDEDYISGGLSGEIAAALAENNSDARFGRVATTGTIPYARGQEAQALPSVQRIITTVEGLLNGKRTQLPGTVGIAHA